MAKTLILTPKIFFREFYLYQLDIVPSYHPTQFKGKPQLRKQHKNLISDPILSHLVQIWAPQFFSWVLPVLLVRHHPMQFLGKIKNKTSENGKKPNFVPNFGPNFPSIPPNVFLWNLFLLLARHCSKLLSYAI